MSQQPLPAARHERIREIFESVPFARVLGLELGEITTSLVVMRLEVRDEHKQNRGLVHGGVLAGLIDTAAAFAVIAAIGEDEPCSTVDLTVHYLRPLLGGCCTARAEVVRAGRRAVVVSVDVKDAGEQLIATAITTFLRLSG
jgi:uncharacterized protein (TIGR00369 family)